MSDVSSSRLGFAGRLAATFQHTPLTPVLALLGLLLGLVAIMITPREEEPQIDVTMANVSVTFPGADAHQVEQLVATPLEQRLSEIEGLKHVYSTSRPGLAIITVEFKVGVPRQVALVRLYNQVWSNADLWPRDLGVGQPVVKPKGIDDVPVMALTLWSDDAQRGALELGRIAHTLESELKRIPGTRGIDTIGTPDRAVRITVDPARMASYGLALDDLTGALRAANEVHLAGERLGTQGVVPVTAGQFLADRNEVAALVLGLQEGKPVRVADVATVDDDADLPFRYVWHGAPPGRAGPVGGPAPAVTLAIAKQPGSNAADITAAVRQRVEALRGELIPEGVHVSVTRDYGITATDKAEKLIHKLVFATCSVVLLVLFALGWREALVVGAAVVLTLALTLFASWAMGFTLNRVSLFALIFSIGILVDDAIVVVENIHRHMVQGVRTLREAIPLAVDEVGGPTILATFTVIAALLPMAFVSGLMGPYMRPIPINASAGMLLSLAVALVVTPWLSLKLLSRHMPAVPTSSGHDPALGRMAARLRQVFAWVMMPFLDVQRGARRRRGLFAVIGVLVVLAGALAVIEVVVLKMLPFDNKSELQVVVDLPEGTPLERTNALLQDLAAEIDKVPEVLDYQGYAGTSAPINFNGLVRQYFLRSGTNVGDLQINLVDKHLRARQSHVIARGLRPVLTGIGARYNASVKLVEVPPGPPVMAPIVAELYGPDDTVRRQLGRALERIFAKTADIVDIDTSVEADAPREVLAIDRVRAARLGVSQANPAQAISTAIGGSDVSNLLDQDSKYPRPIRLRLPSVDQASLQRLLALRVRGSDSRLVPLSELVEVQHRNWDGAIQHKDLLPVVYVIGDESGRLDSPLYGMFDLVGQLRRNSVAGVQLQQHFFTQPSDVSAFSVKWDGEWQITYETFRDMGIAYAAGLVLIYLLVVAQFRSYAVPLVIMAPIPLTVIGVMPGHALLGAQFTATSMIGMIALAGIIVRNSILLVDFINHLVERGQRLESAVIDA
ncbi:MAG TPA: efflux RND transporter permease subunit, partial [Xylella taiwanensis]